MSRYKTNKIKVECRECGCDVYRVPSQIYKNVYCSSDCYKKKQAKSKIKCIDCGKYIGRSRHKRCKECNDVYQAGENHWAHIDRVVVICDHCGKEIKRRPNDISSHNFCDQKCMGTWKSENLVGEKSSSWKGGYTPLIKKIRVIPQANEWRRQVLERDNHMCQECGSEENLEVHHVKEFAVIMREKDIETLQQAIDCSELWDISNGQTLCVNHHAEKHPDMEKLFEIRRAS